MRVLLYGVIHAIELIHCECPVEAGLEVPGKESQGSVVVCDGIVVSAYVTNKRDKTAKRWRRCVVRVVTEQKEVMYGVGECIKQWIERR